MRLALVAGADPGHVFPTAGLAVAARDAGHAVVVFCDARWVDALRRDGIEAHRLPDLEPCPSADDEPDVVRRLHAQSLRMARPFADLVARTIGGRPDLIVADVLAQYGGLSAGLLGIGWAQFVPHQLLDPSRYLPPPGSGWSVSRGPLGRLRDRALFELTRRQWAAGDVSVQANRRSLGLAPGGAPLARLFAGLAVLQLPRPDWPADAHAVGPLEWDPADVDLSWPAGDGPTIFVSASTVGEDIDVLGHVLRAVEAIRDRTGLDVRVACTRFTAASEPLPAWAVAGPGRQGPLLDSATLMVSGGGHGIVAKAAERGVPMVVVPGGGDQRENADRLTRAGVALTVEPDRLACLMTPMLTILHDDSFAARARDLRRTGVPRGRRAVEVLESLVRR